MDLNVQVRSVWPQIGDAQVTRLVPAVAASDARMMLDFVTGLPPNRPDSWLRIGDG